MAKRWRILAHDEARIGRLEERAGISPVVAQLLLCRGLDDPAAVRAFLDPRPQYLHDPDLLPGLPEAAARIHAAVTAGRRICVYGDYDADGMTATSILLRCLRLLGAEPGHYVPNRLDEGYGLNDAALRKIADRGSQLVVSVDCGIGSVREAETARALGLELIITDHHEFGPELPRADVLVHPRLPGSRYPFGQLCGAGVAFKLAWAVCRLASNARKVTDPLREFLLSALGLAAIGTVADVVPLIDENRVLVAQGLASLAQPHMLGLTALLRVAGLEKKPRLASEDIAFSIGPRLNAAGRLGQAQLGIELLTTESPERAEALAQYIDELNKNRDSLERKTYLAANHQVTEQFNPDEDPALVLAGSGWHPGVIGIVAGRLAEKYHRPVVLIALDALGIKPGCGSARSVAGLNLSTALAACGEHLLTHGGHAAAAGLKIADGQVDVFRAAFCEFVAQNLAIEDRVAEVVIDAEALFGQLTEKTVQQMEQLAPFGAGNPRPVLCATGVTLADEPTLMGESKRHLSLRLTQHGGKPLRAVAFGQAEWAEQLAQQPGALDVAFRPMINDFRGRRSVELHLVDWRASTQAELSSVVHAAQPTRS